MKTEFHNYLDSLGTSHILQDKIETILKFYEKVVGIDVDDIFVSEYITENNERIFENLWLFNSLYVMEAKNFVTSDDFDLLYTKKNVVYWQIQKTDYDFENTNDKSRLTLQIDFGFTISGNLKASKNNCNKLLNIFKKYIHPNIIQQQAS